MKQSVTYNFYVIEDKRTGHLMPQPRSRESRTALEPCNPNYREPRLWAEKRYAKAFLTVWCGGILYADTKPNDFTGEVDGGNYYSPGTARNKDNYRVAKVSMKVYRDV